MFSSTIIGLKLLPTTVLHHQITGELMISILLLQDLLAIIILILIELMSSGGGGAGTGAWEILFVLLSLPLLAAFALLFQRYVLTPLFARFDQIQEYIFLLVIGWCLGVAELAAVLGLSAETGAFIAGVAVASSPIAKFVAEVLKPLRDFFLVIFFFAVGAGYNWHILMDVLIPAVLLTAFVMASKPWMFRALLVRAGEKTKRAHAVGVRLANVSEFSLLIAVLALAGGVISEKRLLRHPDHHPVHVHHLFLLDCHVLSVADGRVGRTASVVACLLAVTPSTPSPGDRPRLSTPRPAA